MAPRPLELVHIVRALATTTRVLTIYRVHAQTPRAGAENEGILNKASMFLFRQKGTMLVGTYFRPDGALVLHCVRT